MEGQRLTIKDIVSRHKEPLYAVFPGKVSVAKTALQEHSVRFRAGAEPNLYNLHKQRRRIDSWGKGQVL
ncbi:MAG: hypothetical protein JWN34_6112 [Bryobacterales bacterium]|nr:hypothetical protein [Bryobacterales bacterium]